MPAATPKVTWKCRVVRLAGIVGGTVLGIMIMLTVFQSKLMYHPTREITETPADWQMDYQDVWLSTSDGVKIHGWFTPALGKPRGTLLFFHGNGGNISRRTESLHLFATLGMDVLIIDYRGYGRSEGKPGEEGTYRDAEAAWAYLIGHRGVRPERLIIFGRSMGGAIATELATRYPPAGLIVESSFTSAPDMAKALFPLFPKWLVRFDYNTEARIGRVECPVLVVHSPEDELVPFRQGRRLFQAASEPKTFCEIHGSHNEGFLRSMAVYRPALDKFFEQVLPPRSPAENLP